MSILQYHYDDQHDKTVFHNTTRNTRYARPRPRPRAIFWSQTGLVLRPTVSDHITVGAWIKSADALQARRTSNRSFKALERVRETPEESFSFFLRMCRCTGTSSSVSVVGRNNRACERPAARHGPCPAAAVTVSCTGQGKYTGMGV